MCRKRLSSPTLESREQLFKKAVVLRNDKTMSDAISGVKDLKVKDFRKHESCIKTYMSIVRDAVQVQAMSK